LDTGADLAPENSVFIVCRSHGVITNGG
jgi:hypothetical protein